MNRIEEFLNSLDRRNLILLYLSVVIAGVIVYLNFNENFLKDEKRSLDAQIKRYIKLKNESYIKGLKEKLSNLKNEEKKLLKRKFKLKEEIKRLNILIYTSPVINIDEKEFAKIIKYILYNSLKKGVKISFDVDIKEDKFKIYKISMSGESENVFRIYEFIKAIEKLRKVKNIKYFLMEKKDTTDFNMELYFWSYR